MVNNRPYLHVKASLALKEAVQKAAYEAKMHDSEWVRKILAEACGYDLEAEKKKQVLGRPRIYATDKERLQARENRRRERERHGNEVRTALMKAQGLTTIEELDAWLAERGVIADA